MQLNTSRPSQDSIRKDSSTIPAAPRFTLHLPPALSIGIALVAITLIAFLPTRRNDFVQYDDHMYVIDNPHVHAGLTAGSMAWALTDTHISAWHPLAWWSLQLDADLYGLNPAGFHLTSVLLHAASVVLLFAALRMMTGAMWPAAAVAAIFAIHPLRVESVAWVAERKDVLATFFWMLSLAAYARYARRPRPGVYLLVVLAMLIGLTAKPTLVTLPFALLLLDYWPLGRLNRRTALWLMVEKLPLFALTVAACAVTVAAQWPVIGRSQDYPPTLRIANALTSYVEYLGAYFWPASLSPFYPHPRLGLFTAKALGAVVLLAGITALAVYQARRRPYLLVGWLWYLGTLVPMIGLVQVFLHGHADRYTYIPLIGVTIALVWRLAELADRSVEWKAGLRLAAAAVVLLLTIATWRQVGYWRDTVSLWQRAVEVSADNYEAQRNLASELEWQGKTVDALRHFEAALRTHPDKSIVLNDLGTFWMNRGDLPQAEEYLRAALAIAPDDPRTRSNLGTLLVITGRAAEAEPHLLAAVEARPFEPALRYNLGKMCAILGRWEEADEKYIAGEMLDPNCAAGRHAHGIILRDRGRPAEAVAHLEAAAALAPDDPEASYDLGLTFETLHDLPRAIERHQQAVRLAPRSARYHGGLAHVYAAAGDAASAANHYLAAAKCEPDWAARTFNQAWRLAVHHDPAQRNGLVAVFLAEQVCQATGYSRSEYLDALAAAYAEVGRFDEAVELEKRAASTAGPDRVREIYDRLRLFEARRPFRADVPKT